MWVVRDGDELYVRSMYGRAGAWFRGTQTRRQGRIRSGGVEKDVSFVIDTDPALNDRIEPHIAANIDATGIASSAVSSTQRHETQRSSSCRANRLRSSSSSRPQPGWRRRLDRAIRSNSGSTTCKRSGAARSGARTRAAA